MATPDPSREAFEKHVLKIGETGLSTVGMGTIARLASGDYEKSSTQERWLTWQAAVAHKAAHWSAAQNSPECSQTRMDAGSALLPNNGWQPIETAPKDGATILLLCTSGGIADGCWDIRDESWNYAYLDPTHWQPLPAAPKLEGST